MASVGGAIESSVEALKNGVAGNLAGGTHHAFSEYGEGFCVFNDFAVVSLYLQKNNLVKRIAIVDLDVHQGNKNADILGRNSNVFIFDMHGKIIIPLRKFLRHLILSLMIIQGTLNI